VRRNRRFVLRAALCFSWRLRTAIILALALATGFAASSIVLHAGDGAPERIPSYVTWTPVNIAAASSGNAFRGSLLAKRCDHCHGAEGFSSEGYTPNLAGIGGLAIWKELEDFRSRKRTSRAMGPIAESLTARDVIDVVAYFSALPVFPDPQDNRVFPQGQVESTHASIASRLITFGDGERGIPPCQACHGPVAYKVGVPSLMTQNGDYILNQLEAFANRSRTNDINEPMRVIAGLLSEDERHAIAEYYGAGLGSQRAGAK
jgi:cytochrome c553